MRRRADRRRCARRHRPRARRAGRARARSARGGWWRTAAPSPRACRVSGDAITPALLTSTCRGPDQAATKAATDARSARSRCSTRTPELPVDLDDLSGRALTGGEVAYRERHLGSGARQRPRRLDSDTGRAAGDDDAATAEVDAACDFRSRRVVSVLRADDRHAEPLVVPWNSDAEESSAYGTVAEAAFVSQGIRGCASDGDEQARAGRGRRCRRQAGRALRIEMAARLVADERRELDDHLGDRAGSDAEQERDDAAVEGRGADPGAERSPGRRRAARGRRGVRSEGRFFATGATTASPSVVLWIANPITSRAPSASAPAA